MTIRIMKIFSEKVKYGIAAMFELAKNYSKEVIKIKDIANAQNIPQNFLEQLLVLLKRHDLVESVRGAMGGYRLKKPPHQISVLDIIIGLENSIDIIDIPKDPIAMVNFWNKIEQKFKESLKITLEDLINEENLIQDRLFYQI